MILVYIKHICWTGTISINQITLWLLEQRMPDKWDYILLESLGNKADWFARLQKTAFQNLITINFLSSVNMILDFLALKSGIWGLLSFFINQILEINSSQPNSYHPQIFKDRKETQEETARMPIIGLII